MNMYTYNIIRQEMKVLAFGALVLLLLRHLAHEHQLLYRTQHLQPRTGQGSWAADISGCSRYLVRSGPPLSPDFKGGSWSTTLRSNLHEAPSFGSLRMRGKRVGQKLLIARPCPHSASPTLLPLSWRQFLHLKSQLWVQGHNCLSLYKKGHTHCSLVSLVHWGSNCHSSDTTQVSLPWAPIGSLYQGRCEKGHKGRSQAGATGSSLWCFHTLLSTSQTDNCDEVFLFSYKHVLSQLRLT